MGLGKLKTPSNARLDTFIEVSERWLGSQLRCTRIHRSIVCEERARQREKLSRR